MFLDRFFSSVKELSPEEIRRYMADHEAESYTLLDVRTPEEYEKQHLPGAKLIPVSELSDRLGELDRNKPIFSY